MNDEQKRKEDLEAAKGWYAIAKENDNKLGMQILENLFPELCESEDGRIRKAILHLVKSQKEHHFGIATYDDINWLDMIAWLEKQVEQKPVEWSKEDEKMFDKLYEILYGYGYSSHPEIDLSSNEAVNLIFWLKTLKDRVQVQPQQER